MILNKSSLSLIGERLNDSHLKTAELFIDLIISFATHFLSSLS